MITISWHLVLLIVIALIGFGYVMTFDDTDRGMFGSERGNGFIVYLALLIIVLLIYGGIVWW